MGVFRGVRCSGSKDSGSNELLGGVVVVCGSSGEIISYLLVQTRLSDSEVSQDGTMGNVFALLEVVWELSFQPGLLWHVKAVAGSLVYGLSDHKYFQGEESIVVAKLISALDLAVFVPGDLNDDTFSEVDLGSSSRSIVSDVVGSGNSREIRVSIRIEQTIVHCSGLICLLFELGVALGPVSNVLGIKALPSANLEPSVMRSKVPRFENALQDSLLVSLIAIRSHGCCIEPGSRVEIS